MGHAWKKSIKKGKKSLFSECYDKIDWELDLGKVEVTFFLKKRKLLKFEIEKILA